VNYWTNPELEKVALYYEGKPDPYNVCLAASLRELVALRRQLGITRPLQPVEGLTIQTKPDTNVERKG